MSFTWKDDFSPKIGIFFKSIACLLSEAKIHWMFDWLQLLNQLDFVCRHRKVFMQNSYQWCLRNVQLLRTTQYSLVNGVIFSGIHTVFGFIRFGLSIMRIPVSFTFFRRYHNEHTELSVLLFIQNPYAIIVHILQHYHDFQSNVAIFPSVVQTYRQLHSFSGRIKLIICQIRHELSVTIHQISTSWKKN